MRWHIFAIGKPKLEHARLGIEDYAGRLKPFGAVTVEYLKAASRAGESLALLERSKGMFRVVLDERGEEPASRDLAKKLAGWEQHEPRDFALLVGGADGHSEELRQAAGWTWSLSRLTLQHELALVVALEQLYRACTIKAGQPYHRADAAIRKKSLSPRPALWHKARLFSPDQTIPDSKGPYG